MIAAKSTHIHPIVEHEHEDMVCPIDGQDLTDHHHNHSTLLPAYTHDDDCPICQLSLSKVIIQNNFLPSDYILAVYIFRNAEFKAPKSVSQLNHDLRAPPFNC